VDVGVVGVDIRTTTLQHLLVCVKWSTTNWLLLLLIKNIRKTREKTKKEEEKRLSRDYFCLLKLLRSRMSSHDVRAITRNNDVAIASTSVGEKDLSLHNNLFSARSID
jgi:hypothetical protein